jgi:hypothetical protein
MASDLEFSDAAIHAGFIDYIQCQQVTVSVLLPASPHSGYQLIFYENFLEK